MAKLTLVAVGPTAKANTNLAAHRASETEGEALRRLLEGEGFGVKKVGSASAQQYVSKCPFHEGPGSLERKSPSFYFDTKTSVYYCHSASCGERGNLRTMERFFGIDAEDGYVDYVSSKDSQLKTFESLLTPELRQPFYEHGLTDGTIERFRLGYEPAHTTETGVQIPGRYVIPYLEGRRPKFFRYYAPDGEAKYKYTWESGSEATLFNAQDAMGDAEGRVFLCVTPDTEILTERGWVAFPDLAERDAVAQYDQETGEVSFVVPAAHQVFDYSGEMVSISGRHADLLVTPDHRVIAQGQKGPWRTKPAKEWVGRQNLHFPVAGVARGEGGLTPDETRLLMAWVADDCRMQQGQQVYWNLKKDRKRERLHLLLDRVGVPYREVEYPSHPGWHSTWVRREDLPFDTRSKLIPRALLGWREDARRALLDEARFWDGDGDAEASRFFTGEQANAELVSELAAITGYGCVVRTDSREGRADTWVVGLNARPVRSLADGVSIAGEHYEGRVYCVSVPTTYIVVRRNGRTMVTGQCEGEQKAMLLVQMGYAAVAVPGASQWKQEWQASFTHARQVYVCFDNDNPAFHIYDKPEQGQLCPMCKGQGLPECRGHNPGQEAAAKRVDQIGWRAKNVVLPLPDASLKKTDINDFFMRDGKSNPDFAELVTGKRATPFLVQSLAEIALKPPEQGKFLVDQGILPQGGRLLVAGRPKAGKSLFINNLCLSLAAGIPFLGHFPCDHPTRTMLLDRELSKSGLYTRLQMLMDKRPGYRAAMENLLIDHDHLVRLDQKGAYDTLSALVEQNGVEVLVMDTAYKFMGGDIESSSALSKAFEVLDKLIHETGVSIVMTHHKRKGGAAKGKENTDAANPDDVAGSFLWTGWPNATILLNFLSRSVENPFNTVATFTAFRDAAPPDPLALYRGRDSVAYTAIEPYDEGAMGGSDGGPSTEQSKVLSTETLAALLLEMAPCTEDRFLHVASSRFGCSMPTLKPYFVDALATGFFEKTNDRPPMIKFVTPEGDLESWESSMGLPEPVQTQAFDLDPSSGPLTVEELG